MQRTRTQVILYNQLTITNIFLIITTICKINFILVNNMNYSRLQGYRFLETLIGLYKNTMQIRIRVYMRILQLFTIFFFTFPKNTFVIPIGRQLLGYSRLCDFKVKFYTKGLKNNHISDVHLPLNSINQ